MGEYSLADDVLFVGHSLVGTEIPQMLADAVRARDGSGKVTFQVINGAPLVWNWEHSAEAEGVDARAELPKGETEVVVLTEAIPLVNHITWSDTDRYAFDFYKLAVDANPRARVFMYETWHDLNSGTGVDIPNDDGDGVPWRARLDQDLPRWQGIVDAVNAHRPKGAAPMRLIPAGQAFARLDDEIGKGRVPGVRDISAFFADGIHPNDLGDYFVTMVQFAVIYGQSPEGLPRTLRGKWGEPFKAPAPKLAATLQRIAWEVAAPYVRRAERRAEAPAEAMLVPVRLDVAAPAPAAGPVEAAPAEGVANPSLAMGLNGISDWSTEHPFLDLMKSARGWTGHLRGQWGGWSEIDLRNGGYLDANGWLRAMPKELEGVSTILLTDQPAEARALAGRYRISYAGEGTLEIMGSVANVVRRPGEVRFDFTPGGPGSMVVLTIKATDPAGKGDYLRDIRVVREENIALDEAGVIFNPAWIARIGDLRMVRFMDWMATNDSPISDWEERPKPDDYTYSGGGVPVEVMVALANEIGADPWFTMPHKATDAYVRAFATYVRDHLDPRLKAHVEYSNEVWNWQFKQAGWAFDAANARWGAEGDAWMQFAGMRAAQVAMIWDEVFGAEARARLVKVIATQTGWLGLEAPLLDAPLWVAEDPEHNRPPSSYFDAYAVTGYFSSGLGEDMKAPLVKDWIADSLAAAEAEGRAMGLRAGGLDTYVAAHRYDGAVAKAAAELRDGSVTGDPGSSVADLLGRMLPYQAEVARDHGLALIMYEGGAHVVGLGNWPNDADLMAFFNYLSYTPEMAGLYGTLLAGWKDLGGTAFNAFVDMAGPSKWGSWGALRYPGDENPRWQTLADFNHDIPAWWEDRGPDTFLRGVTLTGGPGTDRLLGTAEEDALIGGAGDDLLIGAGGADRMDGGPGTDTALLPGRRSDYVFSPDGAATLATGPGGATRLFAVEYVRFTEEPDRSLPLSELRAEAGGPARNPSR